MANISDAAGLQGSADLPGTLAGKPSHPPSFRESARIAWLLAMARIKGQSSYRASFYADLGSQVMLIGVEFIELLAILGAVPVFAGFTIGQSVLLFGLSAVIFSFADLLFGEVGDFGTYVRDGKVDVLMLRPLPLLLQVMTNDVQIRRVTRMGLGLAACVVGGVIADVSLTPVTLGFLALALVSGVLFFGGTFIVSGSIQFWLIDARQLGNAFVFSSNYVTQYPAGAMFMPLRVFFTYVIPALTAVYLPVAYAVDAPLDAIYPPWLIWLVLPIALTFLGLALLLWRAGTRHYEGAGG